MTEQPNDGGMRGHFGIGIWQGKNACNYGTLWRSAYQFGAAYIFGVGDRFQRQASDTVKAWRHVPMWKFPNPEDFRVPNDTPLVVVEMGGTPLECFEHPERACYLLGAEDGGVPRLLLDQAVHVVSIPTVRTESFNVAVAGSIVLYDRHVKREAK